MVTFTSLLVLNIPLLVLTTAMTSEVSPIFILHAIFGKVPGGISNDAANGLGFLLTTILIDSTFSRLVVIETGTTAPFSAISGTFIAIWSLGVVTSVPNRALSAPLAEVESKESFGHTAASKVLGRLANANRAMLPFKKSLLVCCIKPSPKN